MERYITKLSDEELQLLMCLVTAEIEHRKTPPETPAGKPKDPYIGKLYELYNKGMIDKKQLEHKINERK